MEGQVATLRFLTDSFPAANWEETEDRESDSTAATTAAKEPTAEPLEAAPLRPGKRLNRKDELHRSQTT